MSKERFTQGPWQVIESKNVDFYVVAEVGNLCVCPVNGKVSMYDCEPDARLIAAAPELYEALCRASKWIDDCGAQGGVQAILDDIESVLAKARGEQ